MKLMKTKDKEKNLINSQREMIHHPSGNTSFNDSGFSFTVMEKS